MLHTAIYPASLAGELSAHLQRSMYGVWYLLHFPSLKIHIDRQAVGQVSICIEAGSLRCCRERLTTGLWHAQSLPYLHLDGCCGLGMLFKIQPGVVAPLTNTCTTIGKPGATLLHDLTLYRQVEQLASSANPIPVH